ncbi:cask-interacting protein (caskin) 1,2 [Tritrichomonas foetus]|uniref:Cask-interacting protein (Caskin) 1,2 n=1 Tax=Tritrichomonas foetus TaxID=1144522 RepID=A0A1J4JP07_9EUKA|nr:cask-interacting protein (caskin) 1,2 [Tritrichomonas foetus]|eukprot:OHS99253.1 cask-interacting protein (caskin) 1,2 [Tritrichomonas foetus]
MKKKKLDFDSTERNLIQPLLMQSIDTTIGIQNNLLSLTNNNFENILDHVINCHLILTKNGASRILHSILIAYDYRPKYQPFFPELISQICKHYTSDSVITKNINEILSQFFLNDMKRNSRRLFFYHECFRLNLLSLKDIAGIMNVIESRQNWIAFFWFSPEIQEIDSTKYNTFLSQAKQSKRTDVINYLNELSSLEANDWKLHKEKTKSGISSDSISLILRNDDIDSLQQLFSSEEFNINQCLQPSVFERCVFLNHRPNLIQTAAYLSSLNCFKFLLLNGADVNSLDNDRMNIMQYAIAGGNPTIIRLLEQKNCIYHGSLQIATMYHQFSIFRWLFEQKKLNIQETYSSFGNVLSQAIFSNNFEVFLLYIKNYEIDPNSDIYYGETPFSSAVYNGNVDMVNFFLDNMEMFPKTECVDSLKPLSSAANHGFTEIVESILVFLNKKGAIKKYKNDINDALKEATMLKYEDIIDVIKKYQ